MTAPRIRLDIGRLRRYAPIAAPVVVLLIGWAAVVQPRVSAWQLAGGEIADLERRLDELHRLLTAGTRVAVVPHAPVPVGRRVPAHSPLPAVLERLALIAREHTAGDLVIPAAANLSMETGSESVTRATGPRASGGRDPDPRVALVGVPLAYTEVAVSLEGSFPRIGQYLWDLRDLPTLTEIHALKVEPASEDGGLLKATVVLFVYRQLATPDARRAGGGE